MGTAQGQIREAQRGWAEISRGPQRYGVLSTFGSTEREPSIRGICNPVHGPFPILCQSRGNPALPPTVRLGELGDAEREHAGSREEPVCCDSALCLIQKLRVVFPCWPASLQSLYRKHATCAAGERARYAQGISHHFLQDQRRARVLPALASLRPVARRLVPSGLTA